MQTLTADRINQGITSHGVIPLPTYTHLFYAQEARGQGRSLQVRTGRSRWVFLTLGQQERIDRMLATKGI